MASDAENRKISFPLLTTTKVCEEKLREVIENSWLWKIEKYHMENQKVVRISMFKCRRGIRALYLKRINASVRRLRVCIL